MLSTADSALICSGDRNSVVAGQSTAENSNSRLTAQDLRLQASGGPPDEDDGDGDSYSDVSGDIRRLARFVAPLSAYPYRGFLR
jgi:hypothetical protein